MKIYFPSILRNSLPVLCLLTPSALLTGCNSNSNLASNGPFFHSAHTASYTGATVNPPTPDHRSRQRPARNLQASRNAPQQGPVAIN